MGCIMGARCHLPAGYAAMFLELLNGQIDHDGGFVARGTDSTTSLIIVLPRRKK